MLKRDIKTYSAVVFSLLLLSSCSTFKKQMIASYLKKTEDSKAFNLNFKEPPFPYVQQKHQVLDAFWLNKKKGSSLSYFSSCSHIPRSLKAFQSSSYPSDLDYSLLKRVKKPDSIYSVLSLKPAKNDEDNQQPKALSFQTHIAVHTFKKQNCFFNINLVAPSQKLFEEELPLFQNFIKNFKLL